VTTTNPLNAIQAGIGGHVNGNGTHPEYHRAESWVPKNLIQVAAESPQPPDLVLTHQGEGVLYRGVTHMISGEPESLKSWVALLAAVEEIHAGRNVIWIDTDGSGPGDTTDRLKGLGLTDEQIAGQFAYIEPDESVTRQQLIDLNAEWQPALVVIDSLNPAMVLHGLNPMGEVDVEQFRRIMLGCWGDATELLLDHVAKDKEKRGNFSIGSQRKQALVKVHIQMEVVERLSRDTTGVAKMTAMKDRPGWHHRGPAGRIGELKITPDNGSLEPTVTLSRGVSKQAFRPTHLMEQVSRTLNAHGGPMTKQEITRVVKGRAEFLVRALDLLVQEGFVRRTTGSRGAHLHTYERPYFEDQDPKKNQSERGLPTSSHVFPEEVL
jgi:hypothetical protein